MKSHQIVTEKFACLVVVDKRGVIIETAPMLGKFKHQKIAALLTWVKRTFTQCTIYNLD